MTSSSRSSLPSFARHFAETTYAIWSRSLSSDPIAQDADALDLELDDVPFRQPAAELETRAPSRRSRPDHLARAQRLGARRVGDHVGERVVHVGGRVLAPHLAVDPHAHPCVARVELVGGHDARAEDVRAVPVLRLARPHADRALAPLHVAGGEVVPDRVAEHARERVARRDVLDGAADDRGELELVVELVAVRRPRHLRIGPDDGVGHPLVVGRDLVPLGRDVAAERAVGVLQMALEGEEVAQRARPQRREQPRAVDRLTAARDRRAGLDERDHVAVEAGVEHLLAAQHADPRPRARLVRHQPHLPSAPSRAARRTASTIFTYDPHRQRLPPSPSAISSSLGSGFASSSAFAVRTNPGVHQPHWNAWASTNARCTGSAPPRPSTVVTSRPPAWAASVRQPDTGSPSTSTVHAPQTPIPHVTRTDVRPSRASTPASISSGSHSSAAARPLSVNSTLTRWPRGRRSRAARARGSSAARGPRCRASTGRCRSPPAPAGAPSRRARAPRPPPARPARA